MVENSFFIVLKASYIDYVASETDWLPLPHHPTLSSPVIYFKGFLPQVRSPTISLISDDESDDESPSIKSLALSPSVKRFLDPLTVVSRNDNQF